MSRSRRDIMKWIAAVASVIAGGTVMYELDETSGRSEQSPADGSGFVSDQQGTVERHHDRFFVSPDAGVDGIQRVIDDHAPNVSVELGVGEYVGSELTLDHGVQLVGRGRNSTTLTLADGANTDLIRTPHSDRRNVMQARLQNLTLDGNRDHNSSGDLVYGSFWNSRFSDCDFVHGPNNGFWLAGSSGSSTDDNSFDGCQFINNAGDGLREGGNRSSGPALGICRVRNCWFGNNGGRGVRLRGNGNVVSHSKFYFNGNAAVQVDRGDQNIVESNDIAKKDPNTSCIEVLAGHGVDSAANRISGNVIHGNYKDAIRCRSKGNAIVALQVHDNNIKGQIEKSDQNRTGVRADGGNYTSCSASLNTFLGSFSDSELRVPSSWFTSGNVF